MSVSELFDKLGDLSDLLDSCNCENDVYKDLEKCVIEALLDHEDIKNSQDYLKYRKERIEEEQKEIEEADYYHSDGTKISEEEKKEMFRKKDEDEESDTDDEEESVQQKLSRYEQEFMKFNKS